MIELTDEYINMTNTSIEQLVDDYIGCKEEECGLVIALAYLKAETNIFTFAHWKSFGETFYGDHLMMERIYDDSYELIDPIAERIISLSGDILDPVNITALSSELFSLLWDGEQIENQDDIIKISYVAALGFKNLIGSLFEETPDSLGEAEDKHNEFIYLLNGRLS